MLFLTKEDVLNLFKESFEIVHFNELEKDGKTGLGKMKHWHIYNIIAKKKQYIDWYKKNLWFYNNLIIVTSSVLIK